MPRGGGFPRVGRGCGAVRQFLGGAGVCRAGGGAAAGPGGEAVRWPAASARITSEADAQGGDPRGLRSEGGDAGCVGGPRCSKSSMISSPGVVHLISFPDPENLPMINGIRLKVCGLTSLVDAEMADRCRGGLPRLCALCESPRHVTLERFRAMAARLPGSQEGGGDGGANRSPDSGRSRRRVSTSCRCISAGDLLPAGARPGPRRPGRNACGSPRGSLPGRTSCRRRCCRWPTPFCSMPFGRQVRGQREDRGLDEVSPGTARRIRRRPGFSPAD